MPKLIHQDTGEKISVSKAGVEPARARGYVPIDEITTAPHSSPPPPESGRPDSEPPAVSAVKADWVAYATAQGVENADELTKAELVERFG